MNVGKRPFFFSLNFALLLMGFSHQSLAESLTVIWEANSEADLAGYNIYVGESTRAYSDVVNVGPATQFTWRNLAAGKTYYFAVTAYDFSGNESNFSAEVKITSPASGNLVEFLDILVLGRTQVDAIFSEPLQLASARDFRNYAINPDIAVIGALPGSDPSTVHLVTSAHRPDTDYVLAVTNLENASGDKVRTGSAKSYRMPAIDTDNVPPATKAVVLQSPTIVKITFSENLSKSQAEDLNNFRIEPDVTILRAKRTRNHSVVKLTTAPHNDQQQYRLTMANIEDLAANRLPESKIDYVADFNAEDRTPPSLISVGVNGRTQIDVNFSEPLDQVGAEDIGNYSINPPVTVVGAILSTNLSTVHLITGQHVENQEYTLSVQDIPDRSDKGNVVQPGSLTYMIGPDADFGPGNGTASGPDTFTLLPNYPNPFNPETEIRFFLDRQRKILLKIYNPLGQTVRTLVKAELAGGFHAMAWDGRNDDEISVPSGVYIYSLEVARGSGPAADALERRVRMMTLLR